MAKTFLLAILLLTLTLSATSVLPPLGQGCVVLTLSKKSPAALAFVEFLRKSEIVELLRHSGFGN